MAEGDAPIVTCTFCGRAGHTADTCPGAALLDRAEPKPPPASRPSIHPDHVLERIRSLRRRGYGETRIVAVLNRDGVPNSKGGPWCRASVRQVLGTLGR